MLSENCRNVVIKLSKCCQNIVEMLSEHCRKIVGTFLENDRCRKMVRPAANKVSVKCENSGKIFFIAPTKLDFYFISNGMEYDRGD